MRPITITALVLGLVMGITFVAPLPSAQSQAAGEGTLWLLPMKLRTTTTPTECGTAPVFNMTSDYPGIRNGTKAYLGRSLGPVGCASSWEYTAPGAFSTTGNFSVLLHLGCDVGVPVLQTGAVTVTIRKNSTNIGSASWNAPSATCPTGTPWKVQTKIATKDTSFVRGDKLVLRVALNTVTTEEGLSKMAHVRVGNATYNSTVSAPGLPLGTSQPAPGDLSQDTNSPTTAAPTGTATATPTGTGATTATTGTSGTGGTTATATTGTGGPGSGNGTGSPGSGNATGGPGSGNGTGGSGSGGAGGTGGTNTGSGGEGGGPLGADSSETKEISGQADMPGPGVVVVAALLAGLAYVARRRREA